jgi:hypothetical protein
LLQQTLYYSRSVTNTDKNERRKTLFFKIVLILDKGGMSIMCGTQDDEHIDDRRINWVGKAGF